MKLLIVLSLIACGYAAKLDRTYLPPASAGTAGGSPGSLNAPLAPIGSTGFGQPLPSFGQSSGNSFGQAPNGFGKASGPGAQSAPSRLYGQPGSQGESLDAGFSQSAPGFGGKGAQSFGAQGGQGFGQQSSQGNRGQGSQGYGGQGSQGFGGQASQGFAGQGSQTFGGQASQGFGGQNAQDYQRSQPQRAQAAADQSAEILRYDNQNDGETFSYSFETSNGISAEESGVATNGVQAQGAFSYSDDDGQSFRVTYTADENGYQPQGDHLPTPHPIPQEILKSIEQNAQAAAAGTQEGAYNPDEDNSDSGPQQYTGNAPTSYGTSSGSNSFNQQGGSPSQVYGSPNVGGPRPQSGQGFQSQAATSQYNGPTGGASSGPSNGFGQSQKSQFNGAPNGAGSFANGAQTSNSFGNNQGPSQQYGAPARPSSSNGFAPSAPASNGFRPSSNGFGSNSGSQPRPSQYQAPAPSGFPSAGRPQGQAQDDSGYQYDRPQASFGQGSNGRPSTQGANGQFRPQNGGSGSQGSFPRPNSNNAGYGSGPAQGSFGSPSGSSSQSSFGSNSPNSFAASGSKGPSSFGSSAVPTGQSSFGPSGSTNTFGGSGSNGFSSANGNGSFGTGNNRPQSSFAGTKGAMSESGYHYDRPASNSGAGPQRQNGFGAPTSNSGASGFGAPRQPPSFSEEEGYKY